MSRVFVCPQSNATPRASALRPGEWRSEEVVANVSLEEQWWSNYYPRMDPKELMVRLEQLNSLRQSNPVALIHLYRNVSGLDVYDPLPRNIRMTEIIQAVLNAECRGANLRAGDKVRVTRGALANAIGEFLWTTEGGRCVIEIGGVMIVISLSSLGPASESPATT